MVASVTAVGSHTAKKIPIGCIHMSICRVLRLRTTEIKICAKINIAEHKLQYRLDSIATMYECTEKTTIIMYQGPQKC